MTLEKEESKKKIIALDGAYKLLKDKHMRLVETHANLLRSNAAGMGELEKAKIASQASLGRWRKNSIFQKMGVPHNFPLFYFN